MKKFRVVAIWLYTLTLLVACAQPDAEPGTKNVSVAEHKKPNIVIIFADDMGWGDIQKYNPETKVPTPNLNMLANEGMIFTDAHSSSAVCTPSRYSLLTGRYAWRTQLKKGVLNGRSPLMIDLTTETLPSLLKRADYNTLMVGKWHLGIGTNKPDYRGRLAPGPNAVGFDYFYGIAASLDMGPYVLIENEQVITPLNGDKIAGSKHRRHNGGGFWRPDEIGQGFKHEEVLPLITDKAVEKIHQASQQDKPFFMYFSLTSPHTPWLPVGKFKGSTEVGYYGDFAAYTDAMVGKITAAIKASGIEKNTLVIFSSDNGANWWPHQIEKYGHLANGPWRGQKADIYEGGHRVPLIVKWPEKVLADSQSNIPVVLNDVMRTLASIVKVKPADGSAPDSYDFSKPLLGKLVTQNYKRPAMIHHSFSGHFAIRVGDWKLIEGLGSGGFSKPKKLDVKPGQSPYQLYNLADDPSEQINLAAQRPEKVTELLAELNRIRKN
ncbi:sulfatase family protein [Gayadomonas joobiniege]|uniref:sulfatase family protein n=1 Tax=Gayadomonas joobiniege TaxID=1234606 RepID=UPI00036CF0C9|nr:arylsulfatase [Gayadomonas joobiniege]